MNRRKKKQQHNNNKDSKSTEQKKGRHTHTHTKADTANVRERDGMERQIHLSLHNKQLSEICVFRMATDNVVNGHH